MPVLKILSQVDGAELVHNPTMRMQMRWLTRLRSALSSLTSAFSKKWEKLWAALCLRFT